jgi:hypothetical protein
MALIVMEEVKFQRLPNTFGGASRARALGTLHAARPQTPDSDAPRETALCGYPTQFLEPQAGQRWPQVAQQPRACPVCRKRAEGLGEA